MSSLGEEMSTCFKSRCKGPRVALQELTLLVPDLCPQDQEDPVPTGKRALHIPSEQWIQDWHTGNATATVRLRLTGTPHPMAVFPWLADSLRVPLVNQGPTPDPILWGHMPQESQICLSESSLLPDSRSCSIPSD